MNTRHEVSYTFHSGREGVKSFERPSEAAAFAFLIEPWCLRVECRTVYLPDPAEEARVEVN